MLRRGQLLLFPGRTSGKLNKCILEGDLKGNQLKKQENQKRDLFPSHLVMSRSLERFYLCEQRDLSTFASRIE